MAYHSSLGDVASLINRHDTPPQSHPVTQFPA